MNNKELLEILIPTVECIDHGCSRCIGSFIKETNKNLLGAGVEWGFSYEDTWDNKVEIKKHSECKVRKGD